MIAIGCHAGIPKFPSLAVLPPLLNTGYPSKKVGAFAPCSLNFSCVCVAFLSTFARCTKGGTVTVLREELPCYLSDNLALGSNLGGLT